jgi:hypothetical protein
MESQTLPPSDVGDERRPTRKATQTGLDLRNRTDVIAVVPTIRSECGGEQPFLMPILFESWTPSWGDKPSVAGGAWVMQLSICVAGLACRNYNSSVEGR